MVNTLFTKVGHFLNEDGELPTDLPGPDRKTQETLDALYDSLDALLDSYMNLKN